METEGVGTAEAHNRALVEASFAAWRDGTGSPYDLLAEHVSWTIVGRSAIVIAAAPRRWSPLACR
jgi:hypothetical protein